MILMALPLPSFASHIYSNSGEKTTGLFSWLPQSRELSSPPFDAEARLSPFSLLAFGLCVLGGDMERGGRLVEYLKGASMLRCGRMKERRSILLAKRGWGWGS